MELKVELVPESSVLIRKNLIGDKFVTATGFKTPSWTEMIQDLVSDKTVYSAA